MLQCMFIGGMLFLGTNDLSEGMANLANSTTISNENSELDVNLGYGQGRIFNLNESYTTKSVADILSECQKDAEQK